MTPRNGSDVAGVSRRELLHLLGVGCGLSLFEAASGRFELTAFAQTPAQQPVTFSQGAVIRTILRDIRPQELTSGSILFHEHISTHRSLWEKMAQGRQGRGGPAPAPTTWGEDLNLITEEMRAAAKDGVVLMGDGFPQAPYRSAEFLKQVSERSGMPIVLAGGAYHTGWYPPEWETMNEDRIADGLGRDARAQRWGAMKFGTSAEIAPDERKVLRAAGKAQARTNLPIFTHTEGGRSAVEQLDLFEAGGAKPDRVAIGHMTTPSEAVPLDVHKTICKRGAFVAFDRASGAPQNVGQAAAIKELVDAGYANQILLSSDFATESQLKAKGGPGYARTVTGFVPLLLKAGVDETTIRRTILFDNPRRFLAFVPRS